MIEHGMTPRQKDDFDRHVTGDYGGGVLDDCDDRECRLCSSPIEDDGTEEEERAAADDLCMDCYEEIRA